MCVSPYRLTEEAFSEENKKAEEARKIVLKLFTGEHITTRLRIAALLEDVAHILRRDVEIEKTLSS